MNEFTPAAYDFAENAPHGSTHTAREIAQQPRVWNDVLTILEGQWESLARFLEESGLSGRKSATLVLTGAGSSAFIGSSLVTVARQLLKREVLAVPTTDIVTHPSKHFLKGHNYLVVHFARSGDSPESIATYRLLKKSAAELKHLVITCNGDGALYREALEDRSAYPILLPRETNDRSLVMTSSFTSMALAALGLCFVDESQKRFSELVRRVSAVANELLERWPQTVKRFLDNDFHKALYLGSNVLGRLGQEASLKMQEMTAGRVVSQFDSYLGVRHGPMVFVDDHCLVFASLSADLKVRRYELDLLRELRKKAEGCRILAISADHDSDAEELADQLIVLPGANAEIDDDERLFTDIVVYQLAGYFACQGLGLTPDNPTEDGMITRVVQGVRIYND